MSNRRAFLTTTAIVAPVLALAACGATGATTTVEQIIADAQAVLSFTSPIVPLLAVFVPGAAAFIPVIEAGLSTATGILGTISSTMTAAQTQPVIGQFTVSVNGSLDIADKAVAMIPNPDQRAKAQAILASARAVVRILEDYATNVLKALSPTVGAALAPARISLHVRAVR